MSKHEYNRKERLPLTAIIPVFNEEIHIEGVIESVLWADEILIVDSFSTDQTLALARQYPVRIVQSEYEYSASQKNRAIPLATYEWILLVDADERVTPALRDEIEGLLNNAPAYDAYWIRRINHFNGRRIRFSGWRGDKVIRLFKRDLCRYEDKHVHAEILCSSGRVSKLNEALLHFTFRNPEHFMSKQRKYAAWSARDKRNATKRITIFHTLLKPAFRFFKHYILQGGILDGKEGYQISKIMAYGVWLRYKYMRED